MIIIGVILGVAAIVSVVVLYFRTSYIPENYVIVIDAGSAHTKLHVFHYRGDKVNGTGMIERLGFLQCNGKLACVALIINAPPFLVHTERFW